MTAYCESAGATIAWEETGEGDRVLLIHGLGYGRWGWGPLLSRLASEARVVSFDNRGIGESSVPAGSYTVTEMVDDALAVLDAAGIDRAHVVGTSLGGMIAQELARRHPERVNRLVLIATTPGTTKGSPLLAATSRLIAAASDLEPEVGLRLFVRNALTDDAPDELVEEIVALRLAHPQDPAGWAAQAAAGTSYDGGEGATDIVAPTLVLTGSADRVIAPANSRVLADLIPRSRLVVVPDAGHLLFWEHPSFVADTIITFLT